MRGVLANGERIKRLRKGLGLTQAQLAQRARCDVKTARRAEQGQSLDMFVLRNIAAVLEVPYTEVVHKPGGRKSREEQHLEQVRRWLEAFNNRNWPELLESFHRQCVLRVPGSPDLAAAGVFRGRSELGEHYQALLETFEIKRIAPGRCAWDAAGDHVYLRGKVSLEHRGHRAACRLDIVHVFRFQEGRILQLAVYCDTLAIYRLLRGLPRA